MYILTNTVVYIHISYFMNIYRKWLHWAQFWNPGPPSPWKHQGTVADWVYEMCQSAVVSEVSPTDPWFGRCCADWSEWSNTYMPATTEGNGNMLMSHILGMKSE